MRCAVCGADGAEARELLDGRRYAVACEGCVGEAYTRWWEQRCGGRADSKADALATELAIQGINDALARNKLTPLARAAQLAMASGASPTVVARAWHAALSEGAGLSYEEEATAWRRLCEA